MELGRSSLAELTGTALEELEQEPETNKVRHRNCKIENSNIGKLLGSACSHLELGRYVL